MRKKLNTLLVFSFLILNVFSMSGFPLYIRTSEGGTITLDVDSADLVENVKQKIQDNVGIAPDRQQLFFAGIELEDVRTLAYYNVQSESSFDLVVIQSMFPEKMSYQAVIRDAANALVANQTVGMRISILQGSASGTAVYVETQTPTANINGLVSLEIGTGTPVTGTFAGINWAAGPYFIKTETDPTGSTSYTITGTSQLLSVPYALYAKTAGSVVETQTLANVAALGNTAGTQIKNVTDPTDAQDAATKAYVDLLEAKLTALEARITALEPVQAAVIGDFRADGVVFWVDPVDNTHGLVCAFSDYATLVEWGCYYTNLSNVSDVTSSPPSGLGAEIGDGINNTNNILNDCPSAPAALAARSLGTEWFLPSAKELNQMYINKTTLEAVAGFSAFSNYYWSSTERDASFAWYQNFYVSTQDYSAKIDTNPSVRAVRAF